MSVNPNQLPYGLQTVIVQVHYLYGSHMPHQQWTHTDKTEGEEENTSSLSQTLESEAGNAIKKYLSEISIVLSLFIY